MRWKMKKEKFWSFSFFVFVLSLAKLLTTFPWGSHCFARSLIAKMPFLCRFTKKGRKKGNPGVPPGNPLHPAGLLWPSGVLPLQTSSICVAYIPPRRWVSRASLFAFPSCLNFRRSQGKRQKLTPFCESRVRATPVSVFFFKTPTQKPKLSAFAPCCEIYLACNGALRESKGHSALWRVFLVRSLPRGKE